MDIRTFFIRSATLLFLESQLEDESFNSRDLVKTGLDIIEKKGIIKNIIDLHERKFYEDFKSAVTEMAGTPSGTIFSREDLLQSFKLICNGIGDNIYASLEQGLNSDYSEATLKRTILSNIRFIQNFYKEEQIEDILNNAYRQFASKRGSIENVNSFIDDIVQKLDSIQVNRSLKDPAVLAEADIGSEDVMNNLFKSVSNRINGGSLLKTGWQALNRMLQGGIRRGEFVIIPALQHKYKTGFTLTLFSQIARLNSPSPRDKNKKPLLLRISFEDSLETNMQFLYQELKYNETRQPVDTQNVTAHEMSNYVRSKLQINGFHVKFLRVDPTQWTYKDVTNKVLELESQGYEIELMMVDYLSMVSTVGCRQGPAGTDMRDLFRRIRNFCEPRKIAVITPHQLSTEAKMLLRSGTSDFNFVKEIAEKGYFTDSKQLDQEVDLEIYIHLAKMNKKSYLTVQRGKHRISTIANDEDKFFMLEFPHQMPIPDDIDTADMSLKKIPSISQSTVSTMSVLDF